MSRLLDKLDAEKRDWLHRCGQMAVTRGGRAFLVGGSVRDLILGTDQVDLDVVIEGDGMDVAQDLARGLGGNLTRHHAFQTAVVTTANGSRIDVTTARREEYKRPGQLPQIVPGDLESDLARRDFTINTMAISLSESDFSAFIDPHDGRLDLEAGCIRAMHPRSFADDPTRVLRALRFSLRYGYRIEDKSEEWMNEAITGGYLDTVSGERVCKELRLMFAESPTQGPCRLEVAGVLPAVYPGLRFHREVLNGLQDLIEWGQEAKGGASLAAKPEGWLMVLGCCAMGLSSQERWNLARQLRLSREERAPLIDSGVPWCQATSLLLGASSQPPNSMVERALREIDRGALLVGAAIAGVDSAEAEMVRIYLDQLHDVAAELDGLELKKLGVPQGPLVGEILERLRTAKLDGKAPNASIERRLVKSWLAENQL
ncbi:MAG: hypothetical protein VX300_07885 [Acidobacteriota bacterium]|nr:hypothetical protein [Acidobacteriota bacterium]